MWFSGSDPWESLFTKTPFFYLMNLPGTQSLKTHLCIFKDGMSQLVTGSSNLVRSHKEKHSFIYLILYDFKALIHCYSVELNWTGSTRSQPWLDWLTFLQFVVESAFMSNRQTDAFHLSVWSLVWIMSSVSVSHRFCSSFTRAAVIARHCCVFVLH